MKKNSIFILLFSSFLYGNLIPIVFEGNKYVNERELYSALDMYKPYAYEFWKKEPKADPQTAALLAQTIKNYYKSRGFFHASVKQSEKNGYIEIFIDEKSSVHVADIAIISKLDIRLAIPFKINELFDTKKFDQSKKDVKLLYANQGYCNIEIEAKAWVDLETDSAYLIYDVTPNELCYFGTIKIYSPKDIDSEIIYPLLYIKEGESFSLQSINRSYNNLYAHEGISKAIIDTDMQSKNKALISVKVSQHEKPIRLQAGIGASSDEGMMFSLGAKHRNFLGNLKTLSLDTRITEIKKSIKSNFDMPLQNRNSTGAEIGYENEKFLGFKEKKLFGSLFLKQREIVHVFQESLLFDSSTTYNSDDQILFPDIKLFVLSPKLQWAYDTRDNILDPTNGYLLRLELMGSILSDISDASYYKYKLSGAYIIPLLPSVIALKMDYGALHLYDGNLPASYRFYSGGMTNNRAYEYRKLGPTNINGDPTGFNSILEMTAEYRFPIYANFRGVVFSDNTFIGEGSSPDHSKGYHSAGVGLRYLTPIGPIAIDFGFDIQKPLDQYAIHFHIGELF